MSHGELQIIAQKDELLVTVVESLPTDLQLIGTPGIQVIAAANVGPPGPPGEQGEWVSLTQAEYDALDPKDPEMLYVIIG